MLKLFHSVSLVVFLSLAPQVFGEIADRQTYEFGTLTYFASAKTKNLKQEVYIFTDYNSRKGKIVQTTKSRPVGGGPGYRDTFINQFNRIGATDKFKAFSFLQGYPLGEGTMTATGPDWHWASWKHEMIIRCDLGPKRPFTPENCGASVETEYEFKPGVTKITQSRGKAGRAQKTPIWSLEAKAGNKKDFENFK